MLIVAVGTITTARTIVSAATLTGVMYAKWELEFARLV